MIKSELRVGGGIKKKQKQWTIKKKKENHTCAALRIDCIDMSDGVWF